MTDAQKRALLNGLAAVCVAVAGLLANLDLVVWATAATSLGTFFVGWANVPRPGDVNAKKAAATESPRDPLGPA